MTETIIKINNLDKLVSLADKFPAVAHRFVDEAIVKSIGEIARQTQPITPVDTARLKNSFQPAFKPFEGRYGSNVVYAKSVSDLHAAGTPYRHPAKNPNAVAGYLEIGSARAKAAIQNNFDIALKGIVSALAF